MPGFLLVTMPSTNLLSSAGFSTAEVEDSSEELLRQLSDAIKNSSDIQRPNGSFLDPRWFFMGSG